MKNAILSYIKFVIFPLPPRSNPTERDPTQSSAVSSALREHWTRWVWGLGPRLPLVRLRWRPRFQPHQQKGNTFLHKYIVCTQHDWTSTLVHILIATLAYTIHTHKQTVCLKWMILLQLQWKNRSLKVNNFAFGKKIIINQKKAFDEGDRKQGEKCDV